jgi:hypothetical protein
MTKIHQIVLCRDIVDDDCFRITLMGADSLTLASLKVEARKLLAATEQLGDSDMRIIEAKGSIASRASSPARRRLSRGLSGKALGL